MVRNNSERQFFFILFTLVALGSLYFVRDYVLLMISAFFLALICHAPYRKLLRISGDRTWLALLLLYASLLLIILAPLTVIGALITDIVRDFSTGGTLGTSTFSLPWAVGVANDALAKLPGSTYQISVVQATEQLRSAAEAIQAGLLVGAQGLGSSLTNLVPALFISFSVFNAVTVNYERMRAFLLEISPLDDDIDLLYISRIKAMSISMARGTVVIALVQGLLTGIFLWIGGVHYAPFLGLLAALASIIPLGAGIIAIPIGLVLLATGNVWQGILQIAGSLLVVSNVDNFLRPRLVSKEASLHPVLVLVGLFAGLSAFGIMGAVYGPVVMIILVTTVEAYLKHFKVKGS